MESEVILQRIIQLVILAIPLFLVPILLKSSNSLLGKISNTADRINSKMGLDRGLDKLQGGLGNRAKNYGRLAGSSAWMGAKKTGSGLANTTGAQKLAGKPGVGAAGRALRRASRVPGAVRGYDDAIKLAAEMKKAEKQNKRDQLARQLLGKDGKDIDTDGNPIRVPTLIGNFAGSKALAVAADAEKKAKYEAIDRIKAQWEISGSSADVIGSALKQALKDGDGHTIEAAVGRLSQMGAYGNEMIYSAATAAQVSNPESQHAFTNAINDSSNYGNIIGSSGDVAKGAFDATGTWQGNHNTLGTAQIAEQSAGSLQRWLGQLQAGPGAGATPQEITAHNENVRKAKAEVDVIFTTPGYESKIRDEGARAALKDIQALP